MPTPEDLEPTGDHAPSTQTPAEARRLRDGDEPTLHVLEVYNRATQEWERARWVDPRRSAVDAHSDRRDQVMRGHMIYGDSRVVPVHGPHEEEVPR